MSSRYLIALDAGTGAARCFIVDTEGKEVYSAYQEWHYYRPDDAPETGFEFDAPVFWKVICDVTKEAMARGGIDPADVVAISTTSLREGSVYLDAEGNEVFATPQRDRRAGKQAKVLSEQFGERAYMASGHWPSEIFAPPRLHWLKENRPETFDRIATLLMINDWLAYRLSGVRGCEPTNAAETCVYDIAQLKWDEALISDMGLDPAIFPEVRPAGTVLGEITPQAAADLGLRPGIPVVVGGADTQCGTLGSGAVGSGAMAAVAGTSTPVQLVLSQPMIDSQFRTWSGPYVVPGQWVLESNPGITGSWLQWFRDAFCQAEAAEAAKTGRSTYDLMMELAARSPVGASNVSSVMGPYKMNARHLLSTAIGAGGFMMTPPRPLLVQPESKGHFIRALLEGFAYAIRVNIEQLHEISGQTVDRLHVCGGAISSKLWVDILANVVGMPVVVPRIKEGSALGAALSAGVGVGEYASFESGVETLIHIEQVIEPDAATAAQYEGFYQRWCSYNEQLVAFNGSIT